MTSASGRSARALSRRERFHAVTAGFLGWTMDAFDFFVVVFLVLRALFGIGMGGEWGVGASLAIESAPRKWRGLLSGALQSGYSIAYLLAAVAARLVRPAWAARDVLGRRHSGERTSRYRFRYSGFQVEA